MYKKKLVAKNVVDFKKNETKNKESSYPLDQKYESKNFRN